MLRALFEYFQKHPDELPDDFQSIRAEEGADRAVCDYIAGMTDPFAVEQFTHRFIPAGVVHEVTENPLSHGFAVPALPEGEPSCCRPAYNLIKEGEESFAHSRAIFR